MQIGTVFISFLFCMSFISFSRLIALTKTFSTMSNRSGERGHACLVPGLRGKACVVILGI